MAKVQMTPSEALVETMRAEGVEVCFGIVGSAFMDALDLFPDAGIRFISVAHEQAAAHAADGLARVTGRPQTCAQNGPGIANLVSAVTAALWAHSPVVATGARPADVHRSKRARDRQPRLRGHGGSLGA